MDSNQNKNSEEINVKKGFFKKAKMSIVNIEKYPELATLGFPKAINYLIKLVAILAIVICVGMVYQISKAVNEAVNYIENSFPNFSYQEGILDVQADDPIIIEENEYAGKIIIDTKTEDQEKINQYTKEIEEVGNGIIILKDKILIKNQLVLGTTTYEYSQMLGQMGITRFEKQDIINYARGMQMISLYISLFIALLIYAFIIYFLNTLVNVLLISVFGYLASLFTRIKMRYVALFNMSVYSITLSMLLNIIYVIVNIFTSFNIEYFDVMYISVAVIYLFAAIFMIKADFIKKQQELIKIAEVEKQVTKENTEENKDNQENKEPNKEDEEEKEDKKDEDKKKDNGGVAPEGNS